MELQEWTTDSPTAGELEPPGAGVPDATPPLAFFGAGLVLSCFSPTFYVQAVRRGLAGAMIFFVLFAAALTGLQTADLLVTFTPLRADIDDAFARGAFPEITVSGGQAAIHAPEPFVVFDEDRALFALDTTGEITEADLTSGRYDQAILLTKTRLLSYDAGEGQVQSVELSDLQLLGDPLEINSGLVQDWVSAFQVIAFVVFAIWNSVVRLAWLGVLGLVLWGITAAIRRGTAFGPVLICGVYAFVPAVYAAYLLGTAGIGFCGMQTLLMLVLWALALAAALAERNGGILRGRRPLRAWRALIGAPMLVVLALDAALGWFGSAVVWPVAALTLVVLVAVGLRTGGEPRPGGPWMGEG